MPCSWRGNELVKLKIARKTVLVFINDRTYLLAINRYEAMKRSYTNVQDALLYIGSL